MHKKQKFATAGVGLAALAFKASHRPLSLGILSLLNLLESCPGCPQHNEILTKNTLSVFPLAHFQAVVDLNVGTMKIYTPSSKNCRTDLGSR